MLSPTPTICYTDAITAFKRLAQYTWKNLAKRHNLNMRWPEVAITNELVYQLTKMKLPYVEIFEATNERTHGHDIEVRVEVAPDEFIAIHLQAKVMYRSPSYTRYDAIFHKVHEPSTGKKIYQWELLDGHRADRIPFYLFYNGFSKANYNAITSQSKRRMPTLLGCSIMHLDIFKSLFLKANWPNPMPKPIINYMSVNEAHASTNALPWHRLFDISYWSAIAAASNGGQQLNRYPASAISENPSYKKIKATNDIAKPNADNDLPIQAKTRDNIAAYCIVVSMSPDEAKTDRINKLNLLMSE